MTYGDAFNDMPEEYRKYREQNIDIDYPPWKSKRELGEADKAIADGKSKAVASLCFQYDGGKWLHMAENITIDNPPYEGMGPKGDWIYIASRNFDFTIDGHGLGLVPEMPGIGRLKVVMLHSETIYEGEARVDGRHDSWESGHPFTESITFRMRRDEKPQYTPDPLPDGLPTLNRCPDCDNTLEQRSMPDGIEEWCAECNVKVEIEQRAFSGAMHFTGDSFRPSVWKLQIESEPGDLIKAAEGVCDLPVPESEPALNRAVVELQVALEEYRKADEEPKGIAGFIEEARLYGQTIHTAKPASRSEDTTAEGQMHPDMIRAELQKAMDESYPVSVEIKPELADEIPGYMGMVTKTGALFARIPDEPVLIDAIYSVKRMGSGNDDAPMESDIDTKIEQAIEDEESRWIEIEDSELLFDGVHEVRFLDNRLHSVTISTHQKDRPKAENYVVPKRCIKQIVGE